MQLPISILQRLQREFSEESYRKVKELFLSYIEGSEQKEHERVLLDILQLANGDIEQVRELVDRAKRDYRDIIFWAEYPSQSKLDRPQKIREFNEMLKKFGAKWQVENEKKDA